ncbi:hypothetical protein J2X46_002699 [Nocardioides sp. BE266]|uniref:hypothetical protein n=1 Tax=Nocardioides sp. BE266 TaxID=2817725 RepID=UPI002859CAFF|nr:hypothetical protein [Nocardioides sp. BE266]MDR7253709.1 hypothetical protein [Nocardioides sp. BE266]
MSSEKEHLAAVLALMGGSARGAYSLGDLKALGTLPSSYNEVHVVERNPEGSDRVGSLSGVQQWRVLIRSVAQIYGNAQEMRRRAGELHGAQLTVASENFYPRRSTTDDPIAPDSGWWSGTSEFTY